MQASQIGYIATVISTQKNLPWKEAITVVLDDAASAMHYTDIAQAIVEQNLRQKVGATPAATVASNITTDIKQLGDKSSFIRVKRGEYMLRKYHNTGAVLSDESPDSSTLDEVSEETGIVQAFGMYWRRNLSISNLTMNLGRLEQSQGM